MGSQLSAREQGQPRTFAVNKNWANALIGVSPPATGAKGCCPAASMQGVFPPQVVRGFICLCAICACSRGGIRDRGWITADPVYPCRMREPSSRSSAPVFEQLEPLLPRVSKPVQYIGGELNSAVKDWDAAGALGPDVPGRLRGGPAEPGPAILYEILNEREHGGRAHVLGVAGPRRDDAGARRAAVHRRQAPAGEGLRRARGELRHGARLHEPAPSLDLAGIPLHSRRPRRGPPMVVTGGHAAFNPEPIADFIDAAVLGDGEEVVRRSPRSSARGRPARGVARTPTDGLGC